MIKYYLASAKLTPIAGKYIAYVDSNMTITLETLAKQISQSGLSASVDEIKGILGRACEMIEQNVTLGNIVQLGGICSLRPTIKGTFESKADGFDPENNDIDVACTVGARLRKGVRNNAQLEKIGKPAPLPDMSEYYDVSTGHYNEDISVGSIGQFNGDSLTFDATDPEQGLFVVDGISPSPMPVATIQKATDKQIVFLTNNIAPAATNVHFLLRRRNHAEGPLVEAQSCELTVTA